ncbi:MAG: glycosyltransferase [Planctomycetota bacterium]|jgi:glycosyltransferase involved in cell wall biosynthesis
MIDTYYQQGLQLIQSGRLEEGLRRLEVFLKQRPMDSRGWNDAGTALLRLARSEEAVRYFLRSVGLPNHPPQVYGNLIAGYMSLNQPASAVRWLKSACLEAQLDQAVFSKVATCLEQAGDAASAMDVLWRGKDHLESAPILDQHIEVLKSKRAKIAFFCGADGPGFLKDIMEYTRRRYPVRFFEGKTAQDVLDLMQWSDISWFEWCTELARIGTNLPKVCRTIIRLHRYEAHIDWPQLINWDNADMLMTVGNEWVMHAIRHSVSDIDQRTTLVTVPNGVDVDAIDYKPRQPGKKIAFVAKLRMVKNPMLLVQCMAQLLKIDPEYKLYMAGERHDLLLRHYLEHAANELGISHAFIYDDFQDDILGWLNDKNFIVSTSVIESQGMGILEAMAAGIKPVVYNFPGARGIFGAAPLFNTPEQFCQKILDTSYRSHQYRQFVEQRYPLRQQLLRVNEIFAKFEKDPVSANTPLHSEYQPTV